MKNPLVQNGFNKGKALYLTGRKLEKYIHLRFMGKREMLPEIQGQGQVDKLQIPKRETISFLTQGVLRRELMNR